MQTLTGTISRLGQNGKSFMLVEKEDSWFSVFSESQLGGASIGDGVGLTYVEKEKDGKVFLNVKGNVSVKNPGISPVPAAVLLTSKQKTGEPSLCKDRLILRQNALTNANSTLKGKDSSPEDIIKVARLYEDYTSGDSDLALAKISKEELPSTSWETAAADLREAS
tara:strand:- start:6304 stop:6801 length:498 start_codon:yes stop_codon:yes gene_type:complete